MSGIDVELRPPGGTEDVMLSEAATLDMHLAARLVASLVAGPPVGRPASAGDGSAVSWLAVPHSDLDAMLLHVRAEVFGDAVRATATCTSDGCGARISVSFSTAGYLGHHEPSVPKGIEPDVEDGWFRIRGTAVSFRAPTAADIAEVAGDERAARRLLDTCARPPGIDARMRRRVERAMEAIAPSLVEDVIGTCPECGASIAMRFDPLEYCLRELRDQALSVFDDVHVLACVYHWPEDRILSLPRSRRLRYAEMAREERRSA